MKKCLLALICAVFVLPLSVFAAESEVSDKDMGEYEYSPGDSRVHKAILKIKTYELCQYLTKAYTAGKIKSVDTANAAEFLLQSIDFYSKHCIDVDPVK